MVHLAQKDDIGNLLPIEIACIYKDIFVVGLSEEDLIYSNDPFYIQTSNGQMVGLNHQFTRFYVLDAQRHLKQTLHITWDQEGCESFHVDVVNDTSNLNQNVSAYLGLSVLCVVLFWWSVLKK